MTRPRSARTLAIAVGAFVFCAGTLPAQDALSVLRSTAENYKKARSYSLEGTDTVEHIAPGGKRLAARRFQARRLEAGMRVDFADGGIRLTDGKYEWNYNPQTERYSKKPVPWDTRGRRALHEFFYNYDIIADFVKRAQFITPPGGDGFLIEVTYELPGGIASEIIKNYWIDSAYTVRRETSYPISLEPRVRLTRIVNFEKTAFDATVDPELFSRPADEPRAAGQAPEFTLPDLAGAAVSLKDLRGKVVLLYFWATWCATCREEMPKLEKLADEYHDRGVVLVGINDEEPSISSEYLKSGGHTLRSLVDRWQDVYKKYLVEQIPAVVVIGRDGQILRGLREAGLE